MAPAGDVSALWLMTQHAIAARVAHEFKNTLNGVAVNLEVVRSRLARAAAANNAPVGTGPSSTTFAETASGEFERLSAQSLALLALVRPVREPADIAWVTMQLRPLLALAAARDGGRLSIDGTDEGDARTSMGAEAVRLVVAQAMLAALEDGVAHEVRCTVRTTAGGDAGPSLAVARAGREHAAGAIVLPEHVARVAAAAGVRIEAAPDSSLILTFPPARVAGD